MSSLCGRRPEPHMGARRERWDLPRFLATSYEKRPPCSPAIAPHVQADGAHAPQDRDHRLDALRVLPTLLGGNIGQKHIDSSAMSNGDSKPGEMIVAGAG